MLFARLSVRGSREAAFERPHPPSALPRRRAPEPARVRIVAPPQEPHRRSPPPPPDGAAGASVRWAARSWSAAPPRAARRRSEALFEQRDAVFSRFRRGERAEPGEAAPVGLVVSVSKLFRDELAVGARGRGGERRPRRSHARGRRSRRPAIRMTSPTHGRTIRFPQGLGQRGGWHGTSDSRRPASPGRARQCFSTSTASSKHSRWTRRWARLGRAASYRPAATWRRRASVDVGLPGGGAVRLVRGALATSGSATRSWRRGGELQHHLIDPRTGVPADSPWDQVTVCGDTLLWARHRRKGRVCARPRRARAGFTERGLPGRFLSADGVIFATPRLEPRRRPSRAPDHQSRWTGTRPAPRGVVAYVVLTLVVVLGPHAWPDGRS